MRDAIDIARQVEHFHDQHDARTVALARALLAHQPVFDAATDLVATCEPGTIRQNKAKRDGEPGVFLRDEYVEYLLEKADALRAALTPRAPIDETRAEGGA